MKLGNANYGNGKKEYVKKNNFKLKDGESVYRILPPMGDLAEKGVWSTYWNIHFGYKTTDGKLKPFQSPLVKNKGTKMIEIPDAAQERLDKMKAQLDQAKKDGNKELVVQLDKLVGQKGQFNLDSNHYMNVMTMDGKIGALAIRHRCKLQLDQAIKDLNARGVDPLSADNGRFFVFKRTGSGLDTSFTVTVYKEKIKHPDLGEVEKEVVHKLTPEMISRFEQEAFRLDRLFERPTSDEVARIVKEGPSAVDEILGYKPRSKNDAQSEDQESDQSDYAVPSSSLASVASAPVITETKAALSSRPTPVNHSVSIAEMSTEDFLKSIS